MSLETRMRRLEGGKAVPELVEVPTHSGLLRFTGGEFRQLLRDIDGRSRGVPITAPEDRPSEAQAPIPPAWRDE